MSSEKRVSRKWLLSECRCEAVTAPMLGFSQTWLHNLAITFWREVSRLSLYPFLQTELLPSLPPRRRHAIGFSLSCGLVLNRLLSG